jgi:DHA2 family lincomycin resistance protein-like MFS transporter
MNKRVQEASGIKRGPMLTALLIGAFVAFLNQYLLANTLPGLMREFNSCRSANGFLDRIYSRLTCFGTGLVYKKVTCT